MAAIVRCDFCGKDQVEKQYHAQMRHKIPIYYPDRAYCYSEDIDLCSACLMAVGEAIYNVKKAVVRGSDGN